MSTTPESGRERDPKYDPKVGDCLRRFGASHRELYRFIVYRDGMRIKFATGANSVRTEVWLTSWSEWAANSDVEQRADDPTALLDVQEFFTHRAGRDKIRMKPVK